MVSNATGDFSAAGVMDELVIRDAPGSPTPPDTPPTATAAPTATPTTPAPPPTGGGITDPDLIVTPAPLELPAVGVPFTDPVFGTTLRRVSGSSDSGGFASQEYSQLQTFSPDNTYLLLTGSEGYHVRRVADLSLVASLDTSGWYARK